MENLSLFMEQYLPHIIITVLVLVAAAIARVLTRKFIKRYGLIGKKLEARTNYVIRVFLIFINLTAFISIVIIWGVNPKNIFIALSSIFAVIGVAFFAQWSLLSNVTAGLLIFFTTPFRIGDFIRIHDKDNPLEAEVIDILTFHTHFKTRDGELVVYPNSVIMQKGISVVDGRNNSVESE